MGIMYSKDRQAGGFSTYANDFGEGIMVFTYDKDRNMIPLSRHDELAPDEG